MAQKRRTKRHKTTFSYDDYEQLRAVAPLNWRVRCYMQMKRAVDGNVVATTAKSNTLTHTHTRKYWNLCPRSQRPQKERDTIRNDLE